MHLSKYQKFSIFYFSVWFLVTWTIFEAMYPHQDYPPGIVSFCFMFAFGYSILILAVTGVPSFWLLKKRDIGPKAKTLMVLVVLILALFLVPRAYSSHVNKMRLQEYVKDLESHGLNVRYRDTFAYGHWTPTWIHNYTEFVDKAVSLKPDYTYVTISAGVPYHFIFFFPRTIEMIYSPYDGYYIINIE